MENDPGPEKPPSIFVEKTAPKLPVSRVRATMLGGAVLVNRDDLAAYFDALADRRPVHEQVPTGELLRLIAARIHLLKPPLDKP